MKNKVIDTDVKKSLEYLKNLKCMKIEKTCGIYIGCTECPFNRFRETATLALRKLASEIQNPHEN